MEKEYYLDLIFLITSSVPGPIEFTLDFEACSWIKKSHKELATLVSYAGSTYFGLQ